MGASHWRRLWMTVVVTSYTSKYLMKFIVMESSWPFKIVHINAMSMKLTVGLMLNLQKRTT